MMTLSVGKTVLQKVGPKRPCLFLDRDGVINLDHGYVYRREDLQLVRGIEVTIRAFNQAGWFVVVVTNQAGIGRGYYAAAAVEDFHRAIDEALAPAGAHVDAFYYCPYHPDATVDQFRGDHPDRKPNPGMILRAIKDLPIDAEQSFLLGDKESDVEAAQRAGIPGYLFPGGDVWAYLAGQGLLPR